MTLKEVCDEGKRRWGYMGLGRGWHMYPGKPNEIYRLEWPDGVIRGRGKSWEDAFADADRREKEAKHG
jgi:hypothetical protein